MAVAWIEGRRTHPRGTSESLSTSGHQSVRLPWFALQVRIRHEAGAAAHLQGMGYEDFLPPVQDSYTLVGSHQGSGNALFPGYVFCRFDPQNRLPILKAPGVLQVVGCSRRPIPVEETEIEALQAPVQSGIRSQPWPYVDVGDKIPVESGPLRGREGVVVEFKGGERLILSIALLQRSVAVEIETLALLVSRIIRERIFSFSTDDFTLRYIEPNTSPEGNTQTLTSPIRCYLSRDCDILMDRHPDV